MIMDIYQFGDSKRTVEDLKDRYYRACKRLYEARVAKGDRAEEYQRKLEMGGYDFDKSRCFFWGHGLTRRRVLTNSSWKQQWN